MPEHLKLPDASEQDPSWARQDALRQLSRSPHPYHLHRFELVEQSFSHSFRRPQLSRKSSNSKETGSEDGGSGWKFSNSPTDSGTEADDESYGLLKSLPAPPVQSRKGLRDGQGQSENIPSPLLTPISLDEAERDAWLYRRQHKSGADGQTSLENEERKAIERFYRRRRAELIRRGTEVLLLGAIGACVLYGENVWNGVQEWRRSRTFHPFFL